MRINRRHATLGALVAILAAIATPGAVASSSPLSSGTPWAGGPVPGAGACDQGSLSTQRPVSLPADDAPHVGDSRNYWEWWFWTGHLETTDHHRFAFAEAVEWKPQLHLQQDLVTFTDLESNQFHVSRNGLVVGDPVPTTNGFNLHGPGLSAVGGNGHDTLYGAVDDFAFHITLESQKQAVLPMDQGHMSLYCQDAFYYQRQHIAISGTVTMNGHIVPVTGVAWEDHSWVYTVAYQVAQSQYLQFQLHDGRDRVGLGRVDHVRSPQRPRHLELRRERVDRDDAPCPGQCRCG